MPKKTPGSPTFYQLHVNLPISLIARVKKLAKEAGQPLTAYVRSVLLEKLSK